MLRWSIIGLTLGFTTSKTLKACNLRLDNLTPKSVCASFGDVLKKKPQHFCSAQKSVSFKLWIHRCEILQKWPANHPTSLMPCRAPAVPFAVPGEFMVADSNGRPKKCLKCHNKNTSACFRHTDLVDGYYNFLCFIKQKRPSPVISRMVQSSPKRLTLQRRPGQQLHKVVP